MVRAYNSISPWLLFSVSNTNDTPLKSKKVALTMGSAARGGTFFGPIVMSGPRLIDLIFRRALFLPRKRVRSFFILNTDVICTAGALNNQTCAAIRKRSRVVEEAAK